MATVSDKCACSLRGRLVGDGCEICNPSIALEYAKERIDELEKALRYLREEIEGDGNPGWAVLADAIDSVL